MTRPLHRGLAAGSLAVTAALTLAACGSDAGDGKTAPSADGGTRTVKTAMGDVKVPAAPKRVVVLDTAELDSAITLGVKPVGSTHTGAESGFLSYLPREKVAGIKDVGEMMSPNLEAVAALKPDLILTSKVRHGALYDELKALAPTVMTENTGYPWKENFQVHADALGKRAEAKRVVAGYTARAAKVTDAVGGKEKAAKTNVNVVRFIEGADIRIYGRKNYIATVLADVGLGRPAVADKAKDGFSYDVSPEKINLAGEDADVVFHSTYGDPEKAKETRTLNSGLWKNMPAAKADKVFGVDDELWIQGIGYTAANKILDELRGHLAT
ncbi:iron-siderophore ABC transporter substrate-binding protein [Streptomyces agglomeratus]|uniref:Iron-siderophore ABC transporter substrate-binding protein n=1 Tax=Streptomyces agglomeratus TaxID=285458 RepID=A0A1E5PA11_9ACTN|nr:iron-siderophore ABC transporter substrate-binding protein [Streptomyces agglomeratus]OEJ26325.1 iron-siderophore ABC transporter substrate-binding protein [Streptomyces agglomeratus]OEJ52179.1 iron-siderophore ABC transporter substrate-binding protein [Streptomyces agglomeratus]OEJ59538.1 iron-siderophore ABC transporter substrate-binding protein [Streptomyces agglomeratus]